MVLDTFSARRAKTSSGALPLVDRSVITVNAALQDRFAEGILLTLIEEGPKALAAPDDYDVRANLMWSATFHALLL